MWKHWIVVICVLVAICHTEARRGRGNRRGGGGRGRGRMPPGASDEGQWVHLLPEGGQAKELAYSKGDQLYMVSKDRDNLKKEQMKPSKTVFDFTEGASPMAVVKVKRRCYLLMLPAGLTRESLQSMITGFSGQRSGTVTAELFATPLNEEQRQSLQSRPVLRDLCDRKPPMALTDVRPSSSEGRKEKTVKVSSLQSIMSITKTRGRGRGNRRRGGGRQ